MQEQKDITKYGTLYYYLWIKRLNKEQGLFKQDIAMDKEEAIKATRQVLLPHVLLALTH